MRNKACSTTFHRALLCMIRCKQLFVAFTGHVLGAQFAKFIRDGHQCFQSRTWSTPRLRIPDNIEFGGYRMNVHWQCRRARDFGALRLLPLKPCFITSFDIHMRRVGLRTGFDSAAPSCHALESSYICMRIPTRDPRLFGQRCCKISGHRHVLLGGWKSNAHGVTDHFASLFGLWIVVGGASSTQQPCWVKIPCFPLQPANRQTAMHTNGLFMA